ncbi:hypothetical protein [Primorskyibacter sp. S187A]|uniref:hypothetical protein n=1 Tax=Primorskyibacter sp. S187A TaxID=3415130 RepID=UPI003C7C8DC1
MKYPFAEEMADTGLFLRLRPKAEFEMFQVMGERASGTNYIRKIMELNTTIRRTDALGWKHGFPTMVAIPPNLLTICAMRHAEAWALSMHKRPWHAHPNIQKLEFSEFIRSPWVGIVDRLGDFETLHDEIRPHVTGRTLELDRHPLTGAPFPNLFALRRAKLLSLVGMLNRDCSVALLQMETATMVPEALITALRMATGAEGKGPAFKTPKRRMGNNFRRSVAARPETPKAMSDDDRAFMRSQLDVELEAALGYVYD